jgi:hypothetical protein
MQKSKDPRTGANERSFRQAHGSLQVLAKLEIWPSLIGSVSVQLAVWESCIPFDRGFPGEFVG